jgi:hypothetical protein
VFKYAAALLLLSWPTSAVVHQDFTFSQWERLQDDDRAAYIAEFIDMLATMAATQPAQRAARHYTQCILARANRMIRRFAGASGRILVPSVPRAPRVAAVGRASKLVPVFGEERVPGNEVHRAGAAISKKFSDIQAEERCV